MRRSTVARGVAGGTLALAATGAFAKLLSAAQRILVARWLGAEAIGLVEMATPVLSLGLTVSGLGLPVALSAAVARARQRGDVAGARAALRTARAWLWASGMLCAAAILVFADRLGRLYGNPNADHVIATMAPAVLLATVLGGERAWLQGTDRVPASAVTVAVEQLGRVTAALAAAWPFRGRVPGRSGLAAQAVAWSPAAGAATGLATSWFLDRSTTYPVAWRAAGGVPAPSPTLVRAGLANWLAGTTAALATAADAVLITARLRLSGWTGYAATAALGELNGMALPLAVAPAVLFAALGSALLPASAADWARGDRRTMAERTRRAYLAVWSVAVPLTLALAEFARPLAWTLYRNTAAAAPLRVLAWVGIPLGVGTLGTVVANAAGRPADVLPGVFAGAVCKTLLVWTLTGRFGLGVQGAAVATLTGLVATALWNMRLVARLCCAPPWTAVGATVLPAAAAEVVVATAVWWALGGSADKSGPLLVALTCGGTAYAALLGVRGRRRGAPNLFGM